MATSLTSGSKIQYNEIKKAANEIVMISSNYIAAAATWLIQLARSAEMPQTLCLSTRRHFSTVRQTGNSTVRS